MNEEQDSSPCPHCGSLKDPWFSRVEPMGYVCQDCGKDWDAVPETTGESIFRALMICILFWTIVAAITYAAVL